MAKMPLTHIEGAVFYVTSRGDNNEEIFKDSGDYNAYLELLRKYKAQHGFRLFAFVLMTNHLHLLFGLKEGLTVSDIMHDLSSNYTKYFNAKYRRKGHLFQERYKRVIIEKASYLSKAAAYIHLNPLALRLVDDLKNYAYSSYPLYIYTDEKTEKPKNQKTAGLNMDEEIKEAGLRDYASFVNSIPRQEMEALGRELNKNMILGSPGFIENVKQQAAAIEAAQARKATRPAPRKLIYISIAAAAILAVFTFYLYGKAALLRKNLKDEIDKKNKELYARLLEERRAVVKDLEEKYAADRVSYEAMVGRLEIEKKKIRELEEKLKK